MSEGGVARAVPFYCPYCGEEDLRPVEEPHAAWHCADCLRVFVVRMVGLAVPIQNEPIQNEPIQEGAVPQGATREEAR